MCYNESALIPHTVKHYKKYLPNSVITIYDNESTDNSVELAKSLGCTVISWSSGNIMDDLKQSNIKNNCWKSVNSGYWVIVADMDEFLCVTEADLLQETNLGTSILKTHGIDMIGESTTLDLSDIDLQTIKKCSKCPSESKSLCFYKEFIREMNYGPGAHKCKPKCTVGIKLKYSKTVYINKHMNFLGLNFYIDKVTKRYSRNEKMRKIGFGTHYTNDVKIAESSYNNVLNKSKVN